MQALAFIIRGRPIIMIGKNSRIADLGRTRGANLLRSAKYELASRSARHHKFLLPQW